MTEVKLIPSYSVVGHYSLKFRHIEICEFMKEFPDLFNFVLEHEKEHAELFEKKGYRSLLGQVWIDLRDQKRMWDKPSYWKAYRNFRKKARGSYKDILFIMAYRILLVFGSIPLHFYGAYSIVRGVFKK